VSKEEKHQRIVRINHVLPLDFPPLDARLEASPVPIILCATKDKAYLYGGACLAKQSYDCPFQSKDHRVIIDGVKYVACERYHEYFQKKKE